jgi:hypothetical protein
MGIHFLGLTQENGVFELFSCTTRILWKRVQEVKTLFFYDYPDSRISAEKCGIKDH